MLAEVGTVIAGPVRQDGRIKQFSTTGAFPGIEGANEIVVCLGKHATFTSWTEHNILPLELIVANVASAISSVIIGRYSKRANKLISS